LALDHFLPPSFKPLDFLEEAPGVYPTGLNLLSHFMILLGQLMRRGK
jgi:hypothetical protein